MYAFDIDSYVMGHIFSDDKRFYDANKKQFIDQAGYGERGALQITTGIPQFATLNEQKGIILDNTVHGQYHNPIPWHGSAIFVLKSNYITNAPNDIAPLAIFGDATTVLTNGALYYQYNYGQRLLNLQTLSHRIILRLTKNDDAPIIVAFALDQSTQSGYLSVDGVTVTTVAANQNITAGYNAALASAIHGARFGVLNKDDADVTKRNDVAVHVFEQHFFADNILTNNLADTKSFIDYLKDKYAIA